ncbi:putative membrane associated protein [Chlamydia trachomatis]|nr:putative membrane associated protein [Chlamydia trachomatis]
MAWKEQKLAAQKQQRIAASCYFESLALCRTYKSGAPSVKGLVNFIQSEILPSGFSKRFKFAVLTQAKPSLLTKKIQLTKTPFDETIETAFSHIREGLYLSESEQRDHDKKLDNEANTSPKG